MPMAKGEEEAVIAVCNDCDHWDECLGEHADNCSKSIDMK